MNRREFTPNGVILGVNPRGLVDRTVQVLKTTDTNDHVRAAIFGYVPSARVLTEGGYETRNHYTMNGWFTPATQDVLVRKVVELSKRVGQIPPK